MPRTLSARELNRATLARQLLLSRAPADPVAAVRRVVALQAQHAASPYVALWNRVADFRPELLDTAFAERTLVKASLLRVTLHAVAAEDYAWVHTAMQPTLRAARLGDPRFTASGLTAAEAHALVPALLAFADRPRTGADVEEWLTRSHGRPVPGAWWALRTFAPLWHAPTGGPWSFGQRPALVAAEPVPPPAEPPEVDAALATVVRRYLAAFGPASVADVAQFCLVTRARVRAAVEAQGAALVRYQGPGGVELLDVPGGELPAEDVPAPARLLGMWDSVLLAYHDRTRVVPAQHRRHVVRSNGDVLPTLLVDGRVVGVWRPVAGGIEASAFEPLPDAEWTALDAEARSLRTMLDAREADPYRRFVRWWTLLPDAEVRVLARD